MNYHPSVGLRVLEKGWAPGPAYLLRRSRILELLRDEPPAAVLEVGCGAGALLHDLSLRGFECTAIETSPSALDLAEYIHADDPRVTIRSEPGEDWSECFRGILSFEVLEHIEDDAGAVRRWSSWLEPGGFLLISVPARQSRWTASDTWAGHLRRYERADLVRLMEAEGFEIEVVESWGFPLVNLVVPFRAMVHARALRRESREQESLSVAERSARSGTERPFLTRLSGVTTSPVGRAFMACFSYLQGLFRGFDWGEGTILMARKRRA